ncbi:MAG: ABC transporter permease subunit [Clostridiales Family XIII bacterium]|jgi:L-cystine transport system permease protein|nr:ABC transporter permease subunit [Clostridiales Family XIII bacterium]
MAEYTLDTALLRECLASGLYYLPQTIQLTLYSLIITLFLGLFCALAIYYKIPALSQFCKIFLTVFRGTPMVLTLLIVSLIYSSNIVKIIEYFRWNITPADINILFLGVLVLSLSFLPASSAAFLGALLSIEKIQFEAGLSIGLTTPQLLRTVIIPQVIPTAMPLLMNLLLSGCKATALVYTIGIVDVMYGALLPCAKYYRYLEGYIAAAIIFWGISIVLNFIINRVSHAVRMEKIDDNTSFNAKDTRNIRPGGRGYAGTRTCEKVIR